MAQQESDREDLIREATALVERIEVQQPGCDFETVIGFKRTGGMSIYFGADPVLQFDESGDFRRGYRSNRLLRTQGTTIAELTRRRTESESLLLRRDLSDAELAEFRAASLDQLRLLATQIDSAEITVLRSVSVDPDALVQRIGKILAVIIDGDLRLAAAIAGRR